MTGTCTSQTLDLAGSGAKELLALRAVGAGRGGEGEPRAGCLAVLPHQKAGTHRDLWLGACSARAAEFRGLGVKGHCHAPLPSLLLQRSASQARNTSLEITPAVCTTPLDPERFPQRDF